MKTQNACDDSLMRVLKHNKKFIGIWVTSFSSVLIPPLKRVRSNVEIWHERAFKLLHRKRSIPSDRDYRRNDVGRAVPVNTGHVRLLSGLSALYIFRQSLGLNFVTKRFRALVQLQGGHALFPICECRDCSISCDLGTTTYAAGRNCSAAFF